jgi:hypothetical protein
MNQLTLEKPFTDPEERYTVTNSKEPNCLKIHNLETGKTYVVNPFIGTCTCPDFEYRTNNGSCKHVDFLQNNDRIKPLIEQYKSTHISVQRETIPSPSVPEVVEQMPYSLMERKDEDQILQEIKGNVIEEFVYSFPQGNKQITGLSYSGVKQIALKMGNIHCAEPILQENGSCWIGKVKAIDVQRNLEMWGVSMQPKFMELRNGAKVKDDFCIQKCVSKAERNALRKLMPEKIIIEMVKEWQKNNGGRKK